MVDGKRDELHEKNISNEFYGSSGHYNFSKEDSQIEGQFLIKRFDDSFWTHNFDIFNEHGPLNTSSYLIINDTKVLRYITPVAFYEHRFENKTHRRMAARFN